MLPAGSCGSNGQANDIRVIRQNWESISERIDFWFERPLRGNCYLYIFENHNFEKHNSLQWTLDSLTASHVP